MNVRRDPLPRHRTPIEPGTFADPLGQNERSFYGEQINSLVKNAKRVQCWVDEASGTRLTTYRLDVDTKQAFLKDAAIEVALNVAVKSFKPIAGRGESDVRQFFLDRLAKYRYPESRRYGDVYFTVAERRNGSFAEATARVVGFQFLKALMTTDLGGRRVCFVGGTVMIDGQFQRMGINKNYLLLAVRTLVLLYFGLYRECDRLFFSGAYLHPVIYKGHHDVSGDYLIPNPRRSVHDAGLSELLAKVIGSDLVATEQGNLLLPYPFGPTISDQYLSDITESKDPVVAFYLRENPNFTDGYGLVYALQVDPKSMVRAVGYGVRRGIAELRGQPGRAA